MRINHNLMAMNANRYLSTTGTLQSKSLEKISSGLRINSAADDAAGLAISEKMRAQIKGLEQSSRNAQDGISLIQTAEGALSETHSILQRMRELAVQATNGTNDDTDRADMQKEVEQLKSEITRISTDIEFNKKTILNGSMGNVLSPTVTDFTPANIQAIGADLGNGTYTLSVNVAGTDEFGVVNSSLNAGFDAGAHIAVNGSTALDYGAYRLEVTNYEATGGTADLTLTGPDGQVTTLTGVDVEADITDFGGLDLATGANNITQNGVVNFELTRDGVDIDLTVGPKTADTSAITSYKGGEINVGGFHFELKTGFNTGGNDWTATLNNNAVQFQIGANANQSIKLAINDMSASALGVDGIDISNTTGAESAITTISSAIEKVSGERSKLGAVQNRLEHTIKNLNTSTENLQASESRIRDVDIAKEMMNYTKLNILQQAAQSMLAQANQAPQGVLQLLR